MRRSALGSVGAAVSFAFRLALCAVTADVGAAQPPAAPQPPVCSSRDTLDDLLSRSAAAYGARDSALGLGLLQQAFDMATVDGCVLERAEALRRLALADSFALRHDEARQKLEEAAAVFRQYGAAVGEARALTQIGSSFIESGPPRKGEAPLRRALELARTIGDPELLRSIYEKLAYSAEPGPEKDRLRDEALAFVRSTPESRSTECNLLHRPDTPARGSRRHVRVGCDRGVG